MQLELPQKIESERECGCTCAILPPNQYPPPKNHWTSNQATLHEGISGFRWIFQRAEEILQTQTCSKDDIFEPLKLSALHLLANWNWEGGVLGTNGTWPWKKAMNKSLPCMTHKKLISFLRRCQWFFGHFHSKNFGHLCFFFQFFPFIAPQTYGGIHYYTPENQDDIGTSTIFNRKYCTSSGRLYSNILVGGFNPFEKY